MWQPFNNAIEDESLKWALQTRTLIFNGTYTILKIILWIISNSTWQKESKICDADDIQDEEVRDKTDCVDVVISDLHRDSVRYGLQALIVVLALVNLACYKWRWLANLLIIFELSYVHL